MERQLEKVKMEVYQALLCVIGGPETFGSGAKIPSTQ